MATTCLLAYLFLLTPYGAEWGRQAHFMPLTVHTIAETFSWVISIMVFAAIWNAYGDIRNGNMLILGCGFLAVGLIDFGHTLAYKGMPDFVTPSGPQKSILFWLPTQLISALTLLLATQKHWYLRRIKWVRRVALTTSLLLAGLVYYLVLMHENWFPAMFIEGQGLTPVKIGLELVIVATLIACAWRLSRQPDQPGSGQSTLLKAVMFMTLGELCFTSYLNVNDAMSLLGHMDKVLAGIFIYRAIFVEVVRKPYIRLLDEVSAHEKTRYEVDFQAHHDPLTGLPNLMLGREHFLTSAPRIKRMQSRMALIHIDLDNFKSVNDALGHNAGDALLMRVTSLLVGALRKSDFVCRQGGDEFLIIVADLIDNDAIIAVLDKAINCVHQHVPIDGYEIHCTLSAGVAIYPDDGEDFDTLLRKADLAMYRAKASGGNSGLFFNADMDSQSKERLLIRHELTTAIERGQFVLYYQSQMDLSSNRIIGAEALIRWHHPRLGAMPPGRFIDVAEESGQILAIGDWVIQEACRQGREWHKAGHGDLIMAVNVSAVQLKRGNLARIVADALQSSGFSATHLELELTESIFIAREERVLSTLQQLKSLGVKLSIDDFGTGYSNLSYLQRLSVDKLKIDQSFTRDLISNSNSAAIVLAIIQMAHSLNLETVAEGVENIETLQTLQTLGCDQIQGYYLARPTHARDFLFTFESESGQGAVLAALSD